MSLREQLNQNYRLFADFNQCQVIDERHDANARTLRNVRTVLCFRAPEFAADYYGSLWIEFGINLGYFTDELDVATAVSFVNVKRNHDQRCKGGDG